MKTQEAINYFGTQTKLAKAIGCTQPTVSGWGEYPPAIQQLRIQHATLGALLAEPWALAPRSASVGTDAEICN